MDKSSSKKFSFERMFTMVMINFSIIAMTTMLSFFYVMMQYLQREGVAFNFNVLGWLHLAFGIFALIYSYHYVFKMRKLFADNINELVTDEVQEATNRFTKEALDPVDRKTSAKIVSSSGREMIPAS